jgi:TolA-binding protein
MVLRASLVFAVVCVLLSSGQASASSGDHDPDDDGAGSTSGSKPRAITGKPVHFERGWLTPFFERGQAKQAVEQFRAEEWAAAETAFARAVKSLPRDSAERRAASYMMALARANQGKWADAGQLFEDLFERYPKLAP